MMQIDNREDKLIKLLRENNITNFTTSNLEIGDVIISNEQQFQIIIERKTNADLIASIKDGRYKEQKIRLLSQIAKNPGHVIVCYIIEGDLDEYLNESYKSSSNDKSIIMGSLISCQFRDKISVIRTNGLRETMDIILKMEERFNKDYKDFFGNGEVVSGGGGDSNEYLKNIKTCKKENLTPETWFVTCLMNIPGVSNTIASKIVEKYPNLQELYLAYGNCENDKDKECLLMDIIVSRNEKQSRRVGPVISKKIFNYMMHNVSTQNINNQ